LGVRGGAGATLQAPSPPPPLGRALRVRAAGLPLAAPRLIIVLLPLGEAAAVSRARGRQVEAPQLGVRGGGAGATLQACPPPPSLGEA
jgi:hypothetical protein